MKKIKNFINLTAITLAICFIFVLLINPEVCKRGITYGILLCGRVIIPSLFPFSMCVIYILHSNLLIKLNPLSCVTKKLFGLNFEAFSIFLFSLIGGYPVGAKMLSEAVQMKKISCETAEKMLCYCINAGPAFVVSAVGAGILGSVKLGYIIFISNTLSSFLIAFVLRFFIKEEGYKKNITLTVSPAENFVQSTAQAASSVMNICSFVVLFSAINSYIDLLAQKKAVAKFFSYLLEVTNAVTKTNNIFVISFLLGFGGISVWCQVLSVANNIKINYIKLIFFRIFHGTLSSGITYGLIKILGIAVPTLSNCAKPDFSFFCSTAAVAASMLTMSIVFLISLSTKKYAGKFIENMI